MIDRNKNTPTPGTQDEHETLPHPHEGHEHDQACPEHHHRCYTRTVSYGYMDCPDKCCPHPEPQIYKTEQLHVPCGVDNPQPQIAAHLAIVANALDEVIQVIDLGHNGWLVFFRHPV